jgi:hypothetical protein
MLLKGAALIEDIYVDPAQRELLDVDLLIRVDQLDAANAALAPLGYQPLPPADGEDLAQQLRLAHHHDPALVDSARVLAIELHHHIAMTGEGMGSDADDLWQRARPSGGRAYLLPSPEDLLFHVCIHFTRNRLGGSYRRRNTGGALAQVADIARIVERETIDWPALARSARRYRLDVAAFMALFSARELGVPIPAAAIAELRPSGFDEPLGRRILTLRVLRTGDHLPVRSARWMLMPSREVLARGWGAERTAPLSLARAYARRARANVPLARAALRRPWTAVQDRRLNGEIDQLQESQ